MIGQNSFTLQNMINNSKPGVGNFNAGLGFPTQPAFQSPYPSPMDMSQQMNMYPQTTPYPMGMYPPQIISYPTMNPNQVPQVPVELEYKPEYTTTPQSAPTVNYVQVPGLPTNPDLAGIPARTIAPPPPAPPQGRYFNVQPTVPGYTDRLQQPSQPIGYNPYDLYGRSAYAPQPQIDYSKPPVGVVNYYNGQPVHPHIHSGWYGSPNYPFVRTTTADPLTARSNIQNPWLQAQEEKRIALMREMQDRANIAAYYGLTYDEWVNNHSAVYQLLSRCCSKYLGLSEEETERRANAWKPKKVEEVLQGGYPPGAFGPDGYFTKEYAEMYCMDHKRLDEIHKTLKVDIVTTNEEGEVIEVIHCKPSPKRKHSWAKTRTMIENMERVEEFNKKSAVYKAQLMEYMYNNAPERALDKTNYGPFEVVGALMKATYKSDMEEKLRKQKAEMRVRRAQANTVSYYYTDTLAELYNQARKSRLEKQRKEWSDLIDKVVPDEQLPAIRKEFERRAKEGRPYIVDGDWVIAKPGVDIVGLPLDVSVNKIIRMNTVTGEEEIYNPDKPLRPDIRAQVEEAVKHPNFYDLNMDREERWKRFDEAGWSS